MSRASMILLVVVFVVLVAVAYLFMQSRKRRAPTLGGDDSDGDVDISEYVVPSDG